MRIAVPIDHLRPGKGGLERWLVALARHLTERGDEVHSVTMDEEGPGEPFRHRWLRPRGLTRAKQDLDFAKQARDFCRKEGYEVVLGIRHLVACDVYVPHGGSVAATMEAHRKAKTFPSIPTAKVRNFYNLERRLLTGPHRPRTVIAVSDRVRDDLVFRYPAIEEIVRVVPNGVDLERFDPGGREEARAELAPDGGRVLLFVAANPRLKGFRTVRTLFERLRSSGEADRLLVAGGDPGKLPRGAEYLGHLGDPAPAYRAADVLVQPTWYDPFPLSTLEALACGTPVVTTRQNGAVSHLGEGGPVRVAESPADVSGLTEAVRGALAEPDREAARALAEKFPLSTSLEATTSFMKDE